ncbi:MAG TPA: hypothetical protein VFT00_00125 [Nocardioides sp.]|nr:hypothetical protein [Nocardioides sp.]
MSTPPRTRSTVAAILLALALTTGACSGDDEGKSEPTTPEASASETTAPPVPTTVTIEKVSGRLPKEERTHLKKVAGDVVDAWFEAAYLGGDYPRKNFHDAFPGFTRGARSEARHDFALMSNAGIGSRIDGVVATRKRVKVDALAANRRAAGATARFVLVFKTTGQARRKLEVRGRLLLTRTASGWRIFGYDVTKGDAR